MSDLSGETQDDDGLSLLFKQMFPLGDQRGRHVGMREEEEGLRGSGEDDWLVKLLL